MVNAGRERINLIMNLRKCCCPCPQIWRRDIHRRLEVEEEVDTMITSKRLEQNIMSAMPFVIILYLRVCNPGYMDALYGNALGIAAMSACLVITAATVIWGRKITDIHM